MRTSLRSTEIGPSQAAESNDLMAFLYSQGYRPLMEAIDATTTVKGKINKTAVRRRLGINRDELRKLLDNMRALLE